MAIENILIDTTNQVNTFTASAQQAITTMYLCNAGNSVVTLDMYITSNGSNASPASKVYSGLELTANDTYVISQERLILDIGDTITVQANTANVVSVTTSYINI